MTNAVKGQVSQKLGDGRSYTLVLDFEGLVEAESAYGKPLAVLTVEMGLGFLGAIRAMLYGALRAHHPELTLKAVGALVQADTKAAEAAIEAAAKAAYPDEAEGKKGANPPRRGTSSGRNGAKPGSTRTDSGGRRRAASR